MSERWLPVVGHEGLYEVSDHGRVRSLDRVNPVNGHRWIGQEKTSRLRDGYQIVDLYRKNRARTRAIHRLVLEAFVGPCPLGMECCHKNGDRADSRLENLRWGTRSENAYDRTRHGTSPQVSRTACPRGHSLVAPNLTAGSRRRGQRSCLACSRGHNHLQDHPDADLQAVSDRYYTEIMSGTARAGQGERTHCPRNHPLAEPNLRRPSGTRGGRGECRACQRARDFVRYHPGADLQVVSDRYYAEIMEDVDASVA